MIENFLKIFEKFKEFMEIRRNVYSQYFLIDNQTLAKNMDKTVSILEFRKDYSQL
jgi:hypothetical protein